MKLLLLLLLIPICYQAQSDLIIDNGEIIWQKVYETELREDEIADIVKANPTLNPIFSNFSGTANPVKMDCAETIPIYLEGKIQFFAIIEFKENRYRVTVSDINVIPQETGEIFGIRSSEGGQNLKDFQLRNNGEFRKNKMAVNTRECIDQYLAELFSFKKVSNDEEW